MSNKWGAVHRPLLEEYFAWLKTIHPEKGSKLEDAVQYSLNQKQQLMAFLDYGDIPISNNLAENAIRPFIVGRKNWLFYDSVKGVESSAIVYSLVEKAKTNSIETYKHLMLVLSMVSVKTDRVFKVAGTGSLIKFLEHNNATSEVNL